MKNAGMKFTIVEKFSGYFPKPFHSISTLKRNHYFVVDDISIMGDAPKELIQVYEFGNVKKSSRNKWILYIAKTGQKWYPIESIMEFMMFRLGQCFGLNMAHSRLLRVGGQVRFLSKYFLSQKDQQLVHGSEIFAGYIEDRELVEEIEEKKMARDLFSVQFAYKAIKSIFPNKAEIIFGDFIKMLLFDAWVGNNDRHFYNWGFVRHMRDEHEPYFSPIYDTARGLFWNESEEKISSLFNNKPQLKSFLVKYIDQSKPKIGFDGEKEINHFRLFEMITKDQIGINNETVRLLCSYDLLEKSCRILDEEFNVLISKERLYLIKKCLEERYQRLEQILKGV